MCFKALLGIFAGLKTPGEVGEGCGAGSQLEGKGSRGSAKPGGGGCPCFLGLGESLQSRLAVGGSEGSAGHGSVSGANISTGTVEQHASAVKTPGLLRLPRGGRR